MTAHVQVGAKRVGFLELFFDLVFVFAVTQLVAMLHADHGPAGWGRSAIMLWLVWWAWSQYAWAGNAIDLDRRTTRIWVLVATGSMLAAAAVIPDAFTSRADGLTFAVLYVAVRLVGLGLYWVGLARDRAHQAALRSYLPVQAASLLLVVAGGVAGGGWRVGFWTAAIVVDVASVIAAGRGEFHVDPAHFAERHGLIVIIALGESVVAAGATATAVGTGVDVMVVLAISFVGTAGLWWCYFDWVADAVEERLTGEPDHRRRAHLARDLFTLGHLPIVAGTIVFAAAVEEALAHPADGLSSFGVTALALGPALFLSGFVAGNLRATGQLLVTRSVGLVAVVVTALVAGSALDAAYALAAVSVVIVAIATVERLGSGAHAETASRRLRRAEA